MSSSLIGMIISILISFAISLAVLLLIGRYVIMDKFKDILEKYKTELKNQVNLNFADKNAVLEKDFEKYKNNLKENINQVLINESAKHEKALDKEKAMLAIFKDLYNYNIKTAEELSALINKSYKIVTSEILLNKRHYNQFESDLSISIFKLETKLSSFQPYIPDGLFNDLLKFNDKIKLFQTDYHNIEEYEKEFFPDEKIKDLKAEISEAQDLAIRSIKQWLDNHKMQGA